MRDNVQDKRVLVLGLGLNHGGLDTVKYLLMHGARVTVTDLRSTEELSPTLRALKKYSHITYVLGRHRMSDIRASDLIFRNPGVSDASPYLKEALKLGVPVTNEAEFFLNNIRCNVIGVTGTRGKSTTSALIYLILKEHCSKTGTKVFLGGNFGTAGLMSFIDRARAGDVVVAELSSFQLEHCKNVRRGVKIAVVTPLYPDHLNRYPSMRRYIGAKTNILQAQKSQDVAILNHDSIDARNFAKKARGNIFYVSRKKSLTNGIYMKKDGITIAIAGKKTRAPHQITSIVKKDNFSENYLTAILAARVYGASFASISAALNKFSGLDFRLQHVGDVGTVPVYNDSCSTTPVSGQRAIAAFNRRDLIMIAGGDNKNLSYAELAHDIKKKVRVLILLPGSASSKLLSELNAIRYSNIISAVSLSGAVGAALANIRASSVLLFSPSATSFNLFLNEFDRGRKFNEIINAENGYKKKLS